MEIPKGDYGYYLNFTVQDSTAVAYNLTGYTVKLKAWKQRKTGNPIINGTCAIVVAASGTCKYLVVDGDFREAGTLTAELQLSQSGIIESTETFNIDVLESA